MSAPDVKRLVRLVTELISLIQGIQDWTETPIGDAMDAVESLTAALSSRPDSTPPQDDVTGRLAAALKALLATGLKGADEYRLVAMACKGDVLSDEEQLQAEEFGAAVKASREALAAYRANPSGWIPVGEMLPEIGKLVLIHSKEFGIECATLCGGMDDDAPFWSRDSGGLLSVEYASHWRPLPPPPQDEHSGRIYTDPEEIDAAQRQEGEA